MARKRKKPQELRQRLPGALTSTQALARMLRVDHAGEFGAQRIYAGQLAVLGDRRIGAQLRHMAAQEDNHLQHFEALLTARQVRPTVLHPLWHVAGFALGAGTAWLGEQAAMACTVAVEEVIDEHYGRQLATLDADEKELRKLIHRFQKEEIEHKNMARDHGAEQLPYYALLRAIIRVGSKTAIWLSERV